MKLYEVYEDEFTTFYISGNTEKEAYVVLTKLLIEEGRDIEEADEFMIDEIDLTKPRVIAMKVD
jgi:hypothetical protein